MYDIVIRTAIPIIILILAGTFSRKIGVLKPGDERVLSAYVYYFALPALFFVNMAETKFMGETLKFILSGITPILLSMLLIGFFSLALRLKRDSFFLLIFCTIFGSLAFFGIPFIMFAFPTREGEHLATLSAASISIISVPISIAVLEMHKLQKCSAYDSLKLVVNRLSRNPLILSILFGVLLSFLGIVIPTPISTALHMLGGTTSAVAIFMLGAFLYGRTYGNLIKAFELSLLRIIFLPLIALLTMEIFNPTYLEKSVIVLMHSMPVAVSTIVLSERYNFHKELIASIFLISTIGAVAYLNLWLLILGIR